MTDVADPDPEAALEDSASGHGAAPGRVASIYGTIVTAAVIASGGDVLSTAALEVSVLVTLLVYWIAEQYAVLLGEHAHAGHLPSVSLVRKSFRQSSSMVSASFIPLAVLFLARVSGLSALGAAEVALLVTVILLVIHGYTMGRTAGLSGARLVAVTATAGLLGIAMVVLKALIARHHQVF